MDKVLVLDGNTRSALAATRSLGRRGLHVVVGDENRLTLAGSSRYCSETITYPPAREAPESFIATIRRECSRRRIGVILPMAEMSTATILKYHTELEHFRVPFPNFDAFDQLTDKWKLFALAQQLNISVPKTLFVADTSALKTISREISFPAVLKPCRSMTYTNGCWSATSVRYANSTRELEEIVAGHDCFGRHPFLIQEFISGQSGGIFTLYNCGHPLVFFSHRRLRENPPSGGVSVLCESVELNPEAVTMAQSLLDHVGWHGVAMVEFKIAPNGKPYLIEVNSRFWGSLQLAIDAGVDFPWLAYQLAAGAALGEIKGYQTGVRCRWLLGDLANLYKVFFESGSLSGWSAVRKWQAILRFLDFFDTASRCDVNRWNDLKPFFAEIGQCLWHFAANLPRSRFLWGTGETVHEELKLGAPRTAQGMGSRTRKEITQD